MLYEKYRVSASSRVKTIKLPLWYQKRVCNSVIAGVTSNQTLIAFAGDLDFVRNWERPQWQCVRKARVDCKCLIMQGMPRQR